MPGAVAILVVLLIFPILASMGGVAVAAALGWFSNREARARHEGSELVDLNV